MPASVLPILVHSLVTWTTPSNMGKGLGTCPGIPGPTCLFTGLLWDCLSPTWYRGDIRKLRELGTDLLDEGRKGSDPRCLAVGEMDVGLSHLSAGDFQSAIESFKAALQASIDPFLIQGSTLISRMVHTCANGQYQEALSLSQEVMDFSEKYGFEFVGTTCIVIYGVCLGRNGRPGQGVRVSEAEQKRST